MKYSHRKMISFIAVFAVLFTQLAGSAYACPMLNTRVTAPMQMANNADVVCDDMDMAQPAMCQHHCQDGQQINNDSALDQSTFAFFPAFIVNLAANITTFETLIVPAPSLHHATSPPLSIQNCCFRI